MKTSFAEGRMRPEAINDTIARIRQTSRDELLLRILAIRAEKKVTAN